MNIGYAGSCFYFTIEFFRPFEVGNSLIFQFHFPVTGFKYFKFELYGV
jgi:hypothetical protein